VFFDLETTGLGLKAIYIHDNVAAYLLRSLSPARGSKYCDEYVCLSVRSHYSKTTQTNFANFCGTLREAVARSISDGVAILL